MYVECAFGVEKEIVLQQREIEINASYNNPAIFQILVV